MRMADQAHGSALSSTDKRTTLDAPASDMTCAYTWLLVSLTLVVVLLPWLGLAAMITGAALAAAVAPYWAGLVVAGVGLALLLVGVLLRQRNAMTTLRAGAWPALCGGDRRPHDHNGMLAAIARLRKEAFDVVGGGWTSWMNRAFASRPALFTDRFHGFDVAEQKWRCGSTIYEMEAYYKRRNLAFPTFPTNGTIALGSWIACENHGNSGDMTGPSHDPFDEVVLVRRVDGALLHLEQRGATVVRRENGVESVVPGAGHPNPTARQLLQENPNQYVVLYAGINEAKMIRIDDERTWLQYRMIEVRTADDVAEWLAPGAALRWLFVGSGRTYGLGVRMEPLGDRARPTHRPFPWCCERPHKEPHCCSVSCRYFQSDPCSFCCGWHEPPNKWTGFADRQHSNDWYPNMFWPAVTLGGVLGGIYNFELIFLGPEGVLTGDWLHAVLHDLIALFQAHRGRCEVRSKNTGPGSWVFLDCGIASKWCGPQIFSEPYRILHKHGVRVVANHTGKFMPPEKYLSGPGWRVRRVPAHALNKATAAAAAAGGLV